VTAGRSVRLFLAEGSASGVLTAEIVNWTGHVVSGPRTRLETALKRDELKRTGVYIIFGNETGFDLPRAYIGEGDDISSRLYSHSKDASKDFWERFVAITNKDMNLTKAHVKYLEGRLISMLRDAKKATVVNKTEPSFDRLPEADISDMEAFLDELNLILPVIGVDFFRKPKARPVEANSSTQNVIFLINNRHKGISAKAQEVDGEFVILAGSTGSLHETVSFDEKRQAARNQILDSGRAERVDARNFILLEDVAFSSPSAASVFLHGTSRNGRTDWLVEGASTTYADWKERLLSEESK
jgi:hypothetical protein